MGAEVTDSWGQVNKITDGAQGLRRDESLVKERSTENTKL